MPEINAPIVAVTVYVDRARVTRRGTIRLDPGEQTLRIVNLPNTLEQDSVRASGRGAGVKISSVEVRTQFITEVPEEKIAALEAQIQTVRDEDERLANEDEVLGANLEFLRRLRETAGENFSKTLAYNEAKPQDVKALTEFLTREDIAMHDRKREIAAQRKKLALEYEALHSRLQQIQPREENARCEIVVTVEAEHAVEFELEVLYVTFGAHWYPLYDVRLLGGEVTLTYMATVSQQSGEDWPEVALSLSTARPALSTELPELAPWYLTSYPAKGYATLDKRLEMARQSHMEALSLAAAEPVARRRAKSVRAPEAPPQAAVIQAKVESAASGTITYRVARPVAVPSDGTPHRTTVAITPLSVALDYVSAPVLAVEAYLRATITNDSPYILLPGSVSIFHGTDFVGRTWIRTVAPTQEFQVQLGLDERVRVERELLRRDVGKSLMGGQRRLSYTYRLTFTSHLLQPTKITVFDQIPVSSHENIRVRIEEVVPKPIEQSDLNIMRWELELEPKTPQNITFSFVVEHQKDMDVNGLPV